MRIFSPDRLLKGMTPQGDMPTEKELLRKVLGIAWPSVLESFLVHIVSVIDTIMVSSLGSYAIAAVGLTNQPKFIALAVFISLNVAISAIIARRKGERDRDSANSVLGQALIITVVLSLVFSILCVVFAGQIIAFAGSSPDTHESSVIYYQIVMGCMFFNVITMVINAAQRGAGNTKITMRTNIISNAVNMVFNYLLIGGNFGFPALGVAGAAIATVIGTVVAFCMAVYSISKDDQFLAIRDALKIKFDKKTTKAILNIGSSTLAEQIFLRIGFLTYSIIVAKLGTTAFAAHQIGMNFTSLSFSFGDGLSVAAVALVGQSLGAKRSDLARIYGSVCQIYGVIFSTVLSIIFSIFGREIYMLFTDEPEILNYGSVIMVIIAFVVFTQIFQVVCSGCLRGAGDAKYTALVSLISVAIIRPFSGWLLCYPLGLGLVGAWIGLAFDQFMRFLLTYIRFRGGKWIGIKI